jgi:GAF domain-containing protein
MGKKTSPLNTAVGKLGGKDKRPRFAVETDRQMKIQKALYQIADAASAVTDMQSFYSRLHQIVGGLMYAGNFFIALYDEQSGLISWPYFVDEVELPRPPQPLADFHGITSWVIHTGKMAKHGWDQSNELLAAGDIAFPDVGTPKEDGIAAPLKVEGKTFGAVFVQSYTKGIGYTDQDEDVLEFVAQHIALALTRARAIEETRQRNSELQIINSVQEGLASKLNMQEIYELVGDKVRETFDAQATMLVTFDHEKNLVHRNYAIEKGQRLYIDPLPISKVWAYFISNRQTFLVNSVKDIVTQVDPDFAPPVGHVPKSVLVVPLMINDEIRGAIDIENLDRENAFTESDVRLLQTLANSMSVALENAHLFDETQRLLKETEQRAAELAVINSVQEGLASSLDIQSIYRLVGDKVREIFKADTTFIVFKDEEKNLLVASYYADKELRQSFSRPYGFGVAEAIIDSGGPLLLGKAEEHEKYGPHHIKSPGAEKDLNQSVLGVPIFMKGKAWGAVSVQSYKVDAFSENDLRLLQTLGNSMSIALENARLFEETQYLLKETEQRAAELAVINSVQEGLASKLDMQAIYELVGEKIRDTFNAQVVSIVTYDRAAQQLHGHYYFEDGRSLPGITLPLFGFRRHVIENQKPIMINEDMSRWMEEYDNPVIQGSQPKSAIFIPMIVIDETIGVISLQNMDRENAFTEADLHLLTTLANSMSVALENARLYEQEKMYRKALQRELEIGREIQAGFLPQELPRVEGWEIAASLMSAREVAGDFYDAFELPDGNIGLVIADVCDKGVGAALFMTLFRSLIRAAANLEYFEHTQQKNAPHSAAERLRRAILLTNNYIAETHGESGMFATLFFGILDPREGRLTYINGGHEPPLIIHAGGVREALCKTGPAVGALMNGNFTIQTTLLHPGDMFFAFTDGVPDCKNPCGDFFGRERLYDLLDQASGSAHELIKTFEGTLHQYIASATQFDDITILAVRRN